MTLFLLACLLVVVIAIYAVVWPDWQYGKRMVALIYAFMVVVPILPLYLFLGAPQMLARDSWQQRSVEQLFSELQQYMRQDSTDTSGWQLLADIGMRIGRYYEAAAAYQHLIDMAGEQPELLLGRADALAMVAGGRLEGEPEKLVRRVLVTEPDNTAALWMLAMSAYNSDDTPQAVSLWRRLWQLLDDDQQRLQLLDLLAAVGEELPPFLLLHVAVAADTKAPDLEAPVFVFAHSPDAGGMPVAASKYSATQLPVLVVLDDSDMLVPGASLADYEQLRVSARLSSSGIVQASADDWQAPPVLLAPGHRGSLQLRPP